MDESKNIYSNVLDRICSLLSDKKITQKELCEHLNLKNKSFTEWKAGRSTSFIKKLPEIATFLGVSVDYLLGNINDPTPPQGQNIKLGIDFGTSFSYIPINKKSPADAELDMKCIKVAEAYRNSEPLVQSMVDRILKIDEAPVMELPKVAARGDASKIPNLSAEELSKLPDLEDI